jgi:hypothetical protein
MERRLTFNPFRAANHARTDDFLNRSPHGSLMTGMGCAYRAAPRLRVRL